MKYIILLTAFFMFVPVKSEESDVGAIQSKVNSINGLSLKKYVLLNSNNKWNAAPKEMKIKWWDPYKIIVYIDDKNRIRKYVQSGIEPEGFKRVIEYFDEKGYLCFAIYNINISSDYSCFGTVFLSNSRIMKCESIENRYDDDNNQIQKLNVLPDKKYYKLHKNVKTFLNDLQISDLNFADIPSAGFCSFYSPKINDTAFINTNNVMIRQAPGVNSPVLFVFNSFDNVKIIDISRYEKIRPFGEFYWYKIASPFSNPEDSFKEGYVFGAFLEPVEVEVK